MNPSIPARFTLYTTPKSGPGCKVLAACEELGLPHRLELVDVYAGEGRHSDYLRINPFGKIPTLVEGDLVLWESNAILLYLAEVHGDYRLSSRDARRRADIVRWMFWESSHFMPAFGPALTEFVGTALRQGRAAADTLHVDWNQAPLSTLCAFLDAQLRDRPFVAGGELSIADFAVAGMMIYARAARFPFELYPGIATWLQALERDTAWSRVQSPLWAPRA